VWLKKEEKNKVGTLRLSALALLAFGLGGCAGVSPQYYIDRYERHRGDAELYISYAQCLRAVEMPEQAPSEPEDIFLQEEVENFTTVVLDGTPEGEPYSAEMLSLYAFLEDSEPLLSQFRERLESGETGITDEMRDAHWRIEHPDAGEPHYVISQPKPLWDVRKAAPAISRTALQASYFSDFLDYESIYACSNVGGRYDVRLSGTDNLAFNDARDVVDFSAMSADERKARSREKRSEMFRRLEDAKDTIEALESLF
jgi:hypothetical protein